jgi:hypothetical protein
MDVRDARWEVRAVSDSGGELGVRPGVVEPVSLRDLPVSRSERSAGILPAQRAQHAHLSFVIAISRAHFALRRAGMPALLGLIQ